MPLVRKLIRYLAWLRDYNLIRISHLFDQSWYLSNNPDVVLANVNPILHFLQYGGLEGRDPGPNFSSKWYLDTYQDVEKAGVNPLVHYLKHGRAEGRKTQPANSLYNLSIVRKEGDSIVNKIHPTINSSGEQKIFCIGLNKTGTTSMGYTLEKLGYKVGIQAEAELLMDDWARRDFQRIIKYCKSADAFQDVPFSLDFTYQILDYAFPGSKFILTIRNNADEWYQSLVRFHAKILGVTGIPKAEDLKNASYCMKGWFWRQSQNIFGVDETTLYDEQLYMAYYTNHNRQVLEYFKLRSNDLLVLNLAEPSSMQFLYNFLGIQYQGQVMPHLNKSEKN